MPPLNRRVPELPRTSLRHRMGRGRLPRACRRPGPVRLVGPRPTCVVPAPSTVSGSGVPCTDRSSAARRRLIQLPLVIGNEALNVQHHRRIPDILSPISCLPEQLHPLLQEFPGVRQVPL